MVAQVPFRQQRGRTMVSPTNLKTYIPAQGLVAQQIKFRVTPKAPAGNYAVTRDARDRVTFTFGLCGSDPVTATFDHNATATTVLALAIAAELSDSIKNPMVAGLGTFTANGSDIDFVSAYPGIPITISYGIDNAYFTAATISDVPGARNVQKYKHGQVCHVAGLVAGANAPRNLSTRREAILPTQDPSLPVSTESFAGVVVDRGFGSRGFVTGNSLLGCEVGEASIDTCVELANGPCTQPIDLLLEAQPSGVVGGTLYYRITPNGAFTERGLVSTTAGTGLIALPKCEIKQFHGDYVTVLFA